MKHQSHAAKSPNRYRYGKGNWNDFKIPLDHIEDAAAAWRQSLTGIEQPWLCWHVDDAWSKVQQALVVDVGWTPLVGGDPRAGSPPVHPKAVAIDFNRDLDLPAMSPMFVLEFIHLFAERLAFWHSDLLVRPEKMRALASMFASLEDGQMAAVIERGGWRNALRSKRHRYWELVGCSTRDASLDQFKNGCGWWMNFAQHPNKPECHQETKRRRRYYWDHGVGIMYWARRYRGHVLPIKPSFVEEGHCTRINRKSYISTSPNNERRDLSKDLSKNFDIRSVCRRLGLDEIYDRSLQSFQCSDSLG